MASWLSVVSEGNDPLYGTLLTHGGNVADYARRVKNLARFYSCKVGTVILYSRYNIYNIYASQIAPFFQHCHFLISIPNLKSVMYFFVRFCTKKKYIFVYLFEHEKVYFSIRACRRNVSPIYNGNCCKMYVLFPILF